MSVTDTSDLTGYKCCFQENQINLAIWRKKWTHLNLTLQESSGLIHSLSDAKTYSCSDANQIIEEKGIPQAGMKLEKKDNMAQHDIPSPKQQPHQNHGAAWPEIDVRLG